LNDLPVSYDDDYCEDDYCDDSKCGCASSYDGCGSCGTHECGCGDYSPKYPTVEPKQYAPPAPHVHQQPEYMAAYRPG